ncbi:hypothetical protein [Bacillus sp. FJAT-28004]|uniref:hypothetical protein n=1 Tax=Bacillus sp. FJAT-28004 TaxID=1679165 RepID=UPI0006B53A1D|nr:hypothetical protein [Bacillus sp. FJAT-28004]
MRLVIVVIFIVMLTGCFDSNVKEIKISNQTDVDVVEINEVQNKKFSYLDQLPAERMEEYELFVKERNLSHLQRFSPKEILLIYMHSVAIFDADSIYALTYNNDLLADPDLFRKEYAEYVLNAEQEVAMKFRYYDSIRIAEETVKEDSLSVVISVSLGSTTGSVAYGLKKEDKVWKMDIQHLIEYFKQKATH